MFRMCVHVILLLPLAVDAGGHRVEQGQTITLTCNTAIRGDVIWIFQRSLTEPYVYVYSNGVVYESYRKRFQVINNDTAGQYRLTISDVQLSDSGIYTCKEDGGFGDSHMFHVNVTSKHIGQQVVPETDGAASFKGGRVDNVENDAADNKVVVVACAVLGSVVFIVSSIVIFPFVRKQYHRRKGADIEASRRGDTTNGTANTSGQPLLDSAEPKIADDVGQASRIDCSGVDRSVQDGGLSETEALSFSLKMKRYQLNAHKDDIEARLKFSDGLLTQMRSHDFTDDEIAQITNENTQAGKVAKLLEILRDEPKKIHDFISCLRNDRQHDIVEYLNNSAANRVQRGEEIAS